MTRVILHAPGGRTVTMHPRTKSNDGLHVFLHRANTRDNVETQISELKDKQRRIQSMSVASSGNERKEFERQLAQIDREIMSLRRTQSGDSAGAGLIGGGHRPEGVHARRTPIEDGGPLSVRTDETLIAQINTGLRLRGDPEIKKGQHTRAELEALYRKVA